MLNQSDILTIHGDWFVIQVLDNNERTIRMKKVEEE